MNEKQLIITMEQLKSQLVHVIDAGISKGVPAFLIEGILCQYLAEIRQMKIDELSRAYQEEKKSDEGEVANG